MRASGFYKKFESLSTAHTSCASFGWFLCVCVFSWHWCLRAQNKG